MMLGVGNPCSFSKRPSYPHDSSSREVYAHGLAFLLSMFLLFLALVPSAGAQDLASISGAVTDPQNAVVTGAAVDVKNTDTGATRSAVTDDAGRFRVASIPVGNYEVDVRKDGFEESVQSGIHLVLGQDANASVALRLGSVSETATVVSDAPPVSVESADVSG
ncbi:MAG TPA: carboxypeptidase-like regulatory domain-containing protein, partial [Candidatus Acidoferrales bacterium]